MPVSDHQISNCWNGQIFHRKYKELFGIKLTKHQPVSVLGEGACV